MGIFGKPNIEKLKEKRDVEGLIKALKDKNEIVRENAAEALGDIGDERAVEPLLKVLKTRSKYVRRAALEKIVGKEKADEFIKRRAGKRLSLKLVEQLGEERNIDELAKLLERTSSPHLTHVPKKYRKENEYFNVSPGEGVPLDAFVVWALAKIGKADKRAIEVLAKAYYEHSWRGSRELFPKWAGKYWPSTYRLIRKKTRKTEMRKTCTRYDYMSLSDEERKQLVEDFLDYLMKNFKGKEFTYDSFSRFKLR